MPPIVPIRPQIRREVPTDSFELVEESRERMTLLATLQTMDLAELRVIKTAAAEVVAMRKRVVPFPLEAARVTRRRG